jgi:hypothetical protein
VSDLGGDVNRVLADALTSLIEAVVCHGAAVARARGLSPIDVRAAGLVAQAGAMRPGELSRALGISPSGTSRRTIATCVRAMSAGVEELRLAPASQVATACDFQDLGMTEREVIAAFVLG